MPLVVVFDALHALTHDGVGDDDRWFTLLFISQFQSHFNLAHVVTVNFDGMPTEGRPFVTQRVDGHHLFGAAVDLQAVAVDDGPPAAHRRP